MAFDAKVLAAVRAAFPGAGIAGVAPLGAPVHDGQCHPEPLIGDAARDDEPPRAGRGRDRHRQDQDAAADRRAALRRGRAGLRRRHQGRRRRARRRGRGERRASRRARRRPASPGAPVGIPDRAPQPDRQARRAAARDGVVVRAARARQGAGPQRHAGERAGAGVQVLRRPQAAAARLQGPARGADPPDRRRARTLQRDYGGISKASVGVLLREMVELEQQGAGAFFGEPELDVADLLAARARRPRARQRARARPTCRTGRRCSRRS